MPQIQKIHAREVLDSRGNPTVEADLWLSDGSFGRAMVPSGASTGEHEALELRDGGERFGGKGVSRAVRNIREVIAPQIVGGKFDQNSLDEFLIALDGTEKKEKLGANAVLAVSLAFSRAAAATEKKTLYRYFGGLMSETKTILPVPMINVLNGGAHAANSTDIQEFMLVPGGAPSFKEALRSATEVFHALKALLKKRNFSTAVGDEGGFAPALKKNEEAIELLLEAIETAGYEPGRDIALAIDAAASEFFENGKYFLRQESKNIEPEALIELYANWCDKYPIVSIEDPLDQNDWAGYGALTKRLGDKIQIVGDDIFVTNKKRLSRGIENKTANAVLIKLNQIGTVSETIETLLLARAAGFNSIISHRSGETEDSAIADLAVGAGTGQIKTGSVSRSERLAKYNQLLRIEEELGDHAIYPGWAALKKNV